MSLFVCLSFCEINSCFKNFAHFTFYQKQNRARLSRAQVRQQIGSEGNSSSIITSSLYDTVIPFLYYKGLMLNSIVILRNSYIYIK